MLKHNTSLFLILSESINFKVERIRATKASTGTRGLV